MSSLMQNFAFVQGAISASDREKIVHCLESIEGDIELGKFKWKDGADVYTSIVEALADKLEDIPKDLFITNKYESYLMILEMWCKSYIDQITTQMKQLQVLHLSRFLIYFRSQHELS